MITKTRETTASIFKRRAEEEIPLKKKRKKLLLFFLIFVVLLSMSATAVKLFSTPLTTKANFGINPFKWDDHWNIFMRANNEQTAGTVTVTGNGTQLEFVAHNVDYTSFDAYGKLKLSVDFELVNDGLQHSLIEFDYKVVDKWKNNIDILDSIIITDLTGDNVVLEYSRSPESNGEIAKHPIDNFELDGNKSKEMRLEVTLRLTQGMELNEDNNSIKFAIPFEAFQNTNKIFMP